MLRNITPQAVFPTFLKVSVTSFMEGCGVKLPTHTLLGLSTGYHELNLTNISHQFSFRKMDDKFSQN